MGQIRTINKDLPRMMRRRKQRSGKVYYYFDTSEKPRREIPLGPNYTIALKKWAELYKSNDVVVCEDKIILKKVWEKYIIDELPKRALNTQRDYLRHIKNILKFFDDAPLDEIEPQHISQYLQWRKSSPIQANREKALFSTLFNFARAWGMTKNTNPCAGIKGHKEKGRQIYIEDSLFHYVMDQSDSVLRRYMQLLYLTGQRSADIFSMSIHDLSEKVIYIEQEKTGQKLRMNLESSTGEEFELGALIKDLLKLREDTQSKVEQLFINESGKQVTYGMMSQRFRRLRKKLIEQLKSDGNEIKAQELAKYQLRDLRAKAGTDTANSTGDIRIAQKQLGHKNLSMTEHYIKDRQGDCVNPTR